MVAVIPNMLTDHGMILEALAAIQSGATAVVKVDQLASLTKIAGTAVLGRAYASHAEDARP